MVITSLTRNQVTGNRPWVRIPPCPPKFVRKAGIKPDFRTFFFVFCTFFEKYEAAVHHMAAISALAPIILIALVML